MYLSAHFERAREHRHQACLIFLYNTVLKGFTTVCKMKDIPGNFLGFLKGTNFAPIANAMGGPNMKPRASIPRKSKTSTD